MILKVLPTPHRNHGGADAWPPAMCDTETGAFRFGSETSGMDSGRSGRDRRHLPLLWPPGRRSRPTPYDGITEACRRLCATLRRFERVSANTRTQHLTAHWANLGAGWRFDGVMSARYTDRTITPSPGGRDHDHASSPHRVRISRVPWAHQAIRQRGGPQRL